MTQTAPWRAELHCPIRCFQSRCLDSPRTSTTWQSTGSGDVSWGPRKPLEGSVNIFAISKSLCFGMVEVCKMLFVGIEVCWEMLRAPTFWNPPIYKLHWGGLLIRKKSDFLHPIFYHVLHPIFIAVAEFQKKQRSACGEARAQKSQSSRRIPWHSDPPMAPWWFIPGNHRLLGLSKFRMCRLQRGDRQTSFLSQNGWYLKMAKKWEGDFLHQICDRNHINHREP